MNYCSKCGSNLPEEAKFCNICGASYQKNEIEQTVAPVIANDEQLNASEVPQNPLVEPAQNVAAPVNDALSTPEISPVYTENNPVAGAAIPEGFLLDATSGLYYSSEYTQDAATGLTVNLVTYFDHLNGTYSQVPYPVEQQPQYQAPQNAAPYNQVQAAQGAPQYPQQPQQPAAPKVPSAASQIASEVGVEAKEIFGSFVKDPATLAANKKLSLPLSIALIVLESASIVFIIDRILMGIMVIFVNISSSGSAYNKEYMMDNLKEQKIFEFSNHLVIALIALISVGLLVLLAYVLPKIVKGEGVKTVDWPDALSITATASIPWTATYILSGLILSITNFSGFSLYLTAALVVVGTSAAVMLYELGLRRHLPSASSRLVSISAGMGISILVTLVLMFNYISEIIL